MGQSLTVPDSAHVLEGGGEELELSPSVPSHQGFTEAPERSQLLPTATGALLLSTAGSLRNGAPLSEANRKN